MESPDNDSIRPVAGNVNINPVNEFAQVLAAAGIEPTEIITDGHLHRCPVSGRPRTKDGAYLFHADENPSGWFQNFVTGETGTWTQKRTQPLTPAERKALAARIEADKARRQAELAQAQAQARVRAERILAKLPPANPEHPYLIRKGIQAAPGTKVSPAELLTVPVLDPDGKPMSMQFIQPDGQKRFLRGGQIDGGFFPIKGDPSQPLHIAEGYATAASIHAATGATVLVAFNAGNLLPVAKQARKYYPNRAITICADDDHATFAKTGKNPGIDKGTEAAKAINASIAMPKFDVERGEKDTDFNDLARLQGLDAVKHCLDEVNQFSKDIAKHQSILDTTTRVVEEDGVLKLVKWDAKAEMEVSKVVASFKIEPFESIYIDGEGQYIKAHLQNCKKRREITLTPDCWISSQKFLKVLPDAEFSFTGNIEVVQLVKRHVAHFDLEQKSGTRTAGFHPTPTGELQFVTEHGALAPHCCRTDLVYLNEIASGCSLQQIEPAFQEALTSLNPILFNFNAYEVTLPVLGWATACFFKDRIHAEYKSFPLLNIEGEAGAGKSSTAREIIMRLWGITSAPRAIAEQTRFTMMRQVSASNTIPLIYEENKSTKMNEKQVQMVSNLIRDTYNAFEGQRGYADQTMRTYRYDAPICIIGETGFSEPALLDRLCTVSLSRNVSKSFLEHFRSIKLLPLEALGRTLLDYALTVSQDDVAAGIEAELAQVDPRLSDRPRLNAAIIRFGLRTLVRILGAEEHISDDEIRSIDQAVINTTSDEDGPTRKSAVDRILEHMARMATKAMPQEGATKPVFEGGAIEKRIHFQVDGEGNLRLWVSGAYPIFQRWAKAYGYEADILPEPTFRKQLKKEGYCLEWNKPFKFGELTHKGALLSIPQMQAKGIELDFIQ
ncbi:conserved hypothetical protein [Solidesulfovibrio fructosivorans JJ]]|uniref:Toprim domain-containing protein n=1 Tax=Solidesulfovibrio fructosivorans JJ] TaxID=596151 RepID=E1JXY3_SOLFR|nr:toprim domain-containing protein [Solidesulfovibrio fructosivorans]EFL50721.1 conserved hypothetical protein [Solidesulfovibrio fructosivorans JJ]]